MTVRGLGRRGGLALAPVWGGLILLVTLVGVESGPADRPIGTFCLICGDRGGADALLNVALFVPLGFGVALAAGRGAAIGSALLLSLTVEALQVLTPGRFPTLGDVVFNTAGGAIGAVLVGAVAAAPAWLASPDRRGRLWLRGFSAALLVVPVVLLAPAAPASDWWMQWTPDLGHMVAYEGRVLDARVGSTPVPDGPMDADPGLRASLVRGADLDVRFVAGAPPAGIAPIVSTYTGDRRQVMMIGADGFDVVYYRRTLANVFALDQPGVRWPAALSAPPGDTVRLRIARDGGGVCLLLDGRVDCSRSLGVRDGWRVLLGGPTQPLGPGLIYLLGLGWAVLGGVPAGLGAASVRAAALWGAGIGVAAGVVAGFVPEVSARGSTAALVVLGALAGREIGRWVAGRQPRSDRPSPRSG